MLYTHFSFWGWAQANKDTAPQYKERWNKNIGPEPLYILSNSPQSTPITGGCQSDKTPETPWFICTMLSGRINPGQNKSTQMQKAKKEIVVLLEMIAAQQCTYKVFICRLCKCIQKVKNHPVSKNH